MTELLSRVTLESEGKCPRCSSAVTMTFSLRVHRGRVQLGRGLGCATCGYREARDRRDIPSEVRQLFAEKFGLFRLRLVDWDREKQDEAEQAVASSFGVSDQEARDALRTLPNCELARDALEIELRDQQALLREAGVGSVIEVHRS